MPSKKNLATSRRMCFVVLIALVQLIMLASFICADSDHILINDAWEDSRENYSKEVSEGQNGTYNWTLQNIDSLERTLNVSISLLSSNKDWDAQMSPKGIITIPYGHARTVTLIVTAPLGKSESWTNVTVVFQTKVNGSEIQSDERYTITTLPGVVIKEEKKMVLGLFENPLPSPLDNEAGVFLLTVLFWLLGSIVLVFILDPVVKSVTKRTKTEIDDIILRIIRTPVLVLVFFYGLVSSLVIIEEHIPSAVLNAINSIYGVALVLILFYVFYKLFKDILVYYSRAIAKKTASNIDDVLVPIVEKFGVVIIALVALGYILGYLNIDLTIFVAGGVVISMVIAFAAQETLSNFFSGIFILTDRPFKEKDKIILPDGDWYEVRHIGLRSTRLFRFKDASLVTIPNNNLANEKIANFTNPYDLGRVMKTFGVAYGSDPEKVKKIIHEVIDANPDIVTEDEDLKPIVRFEEMADSSINFFILVWIKDRDARFNVGDYLNTEIYRRFKEEGIEIPFPQTVVHIKGEKKDEKGG